MAFHTERMVPAAPVCELRLIRIVTFVHNGTVWVGDPLAEAVTLGAGDPGEEEAPAPDAELAGPVVPGDDAAAQPERSRAASTADQPGSARVVGAVLCLGVRCVFMA